MTVNQSDSTDSGKSQATEADAQSLERIKQILFGESLDNVLKQIQNLDARSAQNFSILERRFDEKIESLNRKFESDLQALKQEMMLALEAQARQFNQKLTADLDALNHEITLSLEAQDRQDQELQASFKVLAEQAVQRDQRIQDNAARLHAVIDERTHQLQQQLKVNFDEMSQGLQSMKDSHEGFRSRLSQSLIQVAQDL